MSIQILPESVRDAIAAGEVVERPASILKELIENSLDANATEITIFLEHGGRTKVHVKDNGTGMSPEDARIATIRHATSKIGTLNDLFSVKSYGFRGEALAAAAAVSHFTLKTKTQTQNGIQITQKGSEKTETPVGMNTGTEIIVENLFYSTPARLQYLKKDSTEYRACVKIIQEFALLRPDVSFTVQHNGKKNITWPKTTEEARFHTILKREASSFLPIKFQTPHYSFSGVISAPMQPEASRNRQFLLVNNRPVQDTRASAVIRRAYISACGLEKHLHPAFVLKIEGDPLLIDANVHPRKTEIKFAEPKEAYDGLFNAVINSLESSLQNRVEFTQNTTTHSHQNQQKNEWDAFSIPKRSNTTFSEANTNAGTKNTGFSAKNNFLPPQLSFAERNNSRNFQETAYTQNITPQNLQSYENTKITQDQAKKEDLQYICQLQNKFLLAQSTKGLWMFDQHALHERIRFEKLYIAYKKQEIPTQTLLLPLKLDLSAEEQTTIEEYTEDLKQLGFNWTKTEENSTKITEVPVDFAKGDVTTLFLSILGFFAEQNGQENPKETRIRQMLESKSCRGAIFFGDSINKAEGQLLLQEFQTTKWNLLCPHGRPNFQFFSWQDIAKGFSR